MISVIRTGDRVSYDLRSKVLPDDPTTTLLTGRVLRLCRPFQVRRSAPSSVQRRVPGASPNEAPAAEWDPGSQNIARTQERGTPGTRRKGEPRGALPSRRYSRPFRVRFLQLRSAGSPKEKTLQGPRPFGPPLGSALTALLPRLSPLRPLQGRRQRPDFQDGAMPSTGPS